MNILVVSSFLPYPLFSGGHIRLYNILKRLSVHHKLTLVCEKREYQTEEDIKEVRKFCKNIKVFERKKQWSCKNILYAGFSALPFLMVGHTNKLMKEEIGKILENEKFDLIHVETFYVMQNVPATSLPVVLVEHNIEYLVYQRFTNLMPLVLRPLLYIDILKLKYWEKRFWEKATKLIAVSGEEKQLMGRDAEVVANGVDVTKFKVKSEKFRVDKKEKRILFIGDFKWVQNRNAAEWLLREFWPRIHWLDLKLWIVGKNIPVYIKSLASGNIVFDEDASSDTSKIFQEAYLLIAPIRVGGGTSFKILEAMSSGVPVVTTRLGIEGIEAKEDKEVLIAENVNDFAEKIQTLLKDKTLYDTLSKNARSLIEKKYNWDIIVRQLEKVYQLAIKRND